MTDQEFENLAKRWPDLFQKARVESFETDIGWLSIIDVLCGLLSRRVEVAKSTLKYALENPDSKFTKSISELEASVATELENLPTIAQVKEKFGGLRFYVDGGTEEMHNYINFAEAMSVHVCEICGAPGKTDGAGWVKTLCEKHHKERDLRE